MIWICDVLGMLAVFASGDVSLSVAGVVLVIGLWSLRKTWHLKEKPLFIVMLAIILAAFGVSFLSRVHPVVVAAHTAPALHALLWVALGIPPIRKWRLAIGFLEVAAASALSPEFYLAPVIILFSIFGFLTLAEEVNREAGYAGLAPRFRSRTVGLSLVILLSGLLVFPFLPRTQSGLEMGWLQTRVGYSESVDLGRSSIQPGEGRTVVRMFLPENGSMPPLRLLRTRTLDIFDGKSWYPNHRKPERVVPTSTEPASLMYEMVREPTQTDYLPVPYGALSVSMTNGFGSNLARETVSREFLNPRSYSRRTQYQVRVQEAVREVILDPPHEHHLRIPALVDRPRLRNLSQSILPAGEVLQSKLNRLSQYFIREQFKGELPQDKTSSDSSLERFLLESKKGHCELFATSAAILLRMSGVPTRLVAGFRVSRLPITGFVNVTDSDAHAWVEVWTGQYWIPYDPTPLNLTMLTWRDRWTDEYERVKSYWYRYIVTYDAAAGVSGLFAPAFNRSSRSQPLRIEKETFRISQSWIAGGLIGLAVLLVLMTWVIRLRNRRREKYYLSPRRKRAQSLRKRLPEGVVPGQDEWFKVYDEVRFGPETEVMDEKLNWLKQEFKRFEGV